MKQNVLIENQMVSKEHVAIILGLDLDTVSILLSELAAKRIVLFKKNDLNYCKFKFVGVVVWRNSTFTVLPKIYGDRTSGIESRAILQVVQHSIVRYLSLVDSKVAMDTGVSNDPESRRQTLRLGTMIALLEDFANQPELGNKVRTLEISGEGETDWQATLEEFIPWKVSGHFRFLDRVTYRDSIDVESLLRRIHRAILQSCDEELQRWGVDGIFVEPSHIEDADDLADITENFDTLHFLDHMLSVTYREDLILRIRLMIDFLKSMETLRSSTDLVILGAQNYHVIWEAACSFTLGNQFRQETEGPSVSPSVQVKFLKQESFTFGDSESFRWRRYGVDGAYGNPLNPDLIISGLRPSGLDAVAVNDKYLWVLDAKYYDVESAAMPIFGIEDVIKQHLYQLAIERRVSPGSVFHRGNYFLYPSSGDKIIDFGEVSLDLLSPMLPTNIGTFGLPFLRTLRHFSFRPSASLRAEFIDFVWCN